VKQLPLVALTSDGRKVVQVTATGPTSYTTGGFRVVIGELEKIHALLVSVRTNLKVSNYVHVVDYSYAGNTITFTVHRIDVTAAAPAAWSEVPDGTDISGLVLEIVAIGV
jgi:hypothetical protein